MLGKNQYHYPHYDCACENMESAALACYCSGNEIIFKDFALDEKSNPILKHPNGTEPIFCQDYLTYCTACNTLVQCYDCKTHTKWVGDEDGGVNWCKCKSTTAGSFDWRWKL